MKFLLPFIFIGTLMSCSEDKAFEKELVTTIYYEFFDSSVPPENHRSYEIKVEQEEATIVVDSYGDVLHESTYKVSAEKYDRLIELLNEAHLRSCKISEPEPCSGGTGEQLTIFEGSIATELYLDHCGNTDDYPSSCGDVRAIIDHIKSMIPDLDQMLQ